MWNWYVVDAFGKDYNFEPLSKDEAKQTLRFVRMLVETKKNHIKYHLEKRLEA